MDLQLDKPAMGLIFPRILFLGGDRDTQSLIKLSTKQQIVNGRALYL